MKKKLLKNLGLKLLSVAVAIIVWFVVVMTQNPKDTKTFYDIQVRLVNAELLEKEGKVYEVLDRTDQVRVTVEMPRNRMSELVREDIVAEADISKLTEINTVPISCYVMNQNLNISDVTCNRDVVRLSVEDEMRKWINVQHSLIGEVEEGFVVDSVSKSLTRIQVTGPKSVVERISSAVAEVDVTKATSDVSVNVEPQFYDAEGNLMQLRNVSKSEENIHMEVRILATKEIPVEAGFMGVPAEGYLLTGQMTVDPPTVMVAGTLSTLMGVNKVTIPQEELDITGCEEDYTASLNIRKFLPDSVKLIEGSSGKVNITVGVEPRVERTLTVPERSISIRSLPEGLEAELERSGEESLSYRLILMGLEKDVSAVNQAEVQGVIDVEAWMEEQEISELVPGSYLLPVSFELGEGVSLKEELLVNLKIMEVEEE